MCGDRNRMSLFCIRSEKIELPAMLLDYFLWSLSNKSKPTCSQLKTIIQTLIDISVFYVTICLYCPNEVIGSEIYIILELSVLSHHTLQTIKFFFLHNSSTIQANQIGHQWQPTNKPFSIYESISPLFPKNSSYLAETSNNLHTYSLLYISIWIQVSFMTWHDNQEKESQHLLSSATCHPHFYNS